MNREGLRQLLQIAEMHALHAGSDLARAQKALSALQAQFAALDQTSETANEFHTAKAVSKWRAHANAHKKALNFEMARLRVDVEELRTKAATAQGRKAVLEQLSARFRR